MILPIMGCLFAIMGIFTVGIIFVPIAALCAILGLAGGAVNGNFVAVVLSIVAIALTCWGYALSPSMWLITAAFMGAR